MLLMVIQVKQKKKSSNKWNCVVCNEKQSVQKVFFEGFLAKDVRKFVQNFNMSRQFTEESIKETLISPFEEEIDDHSQNNNNFQRKRRSDWSEYLDPNIEDEREGEQQKTVYAIAFEMNW
ncbi:hypothetical protein BVC80_9041g6 [Macleaya cordata]|uniref:MRN complex-interacting protein N-terminal domain-containing protein n=1 Tax=Macleaya cordata TaxID=56857 RepID=A0A200R2R7_MACCD|nr:hypothetical protein BVC80_9041g6 [Macleaya cordata]